MGLSHDDSTKGVFPVMHQGQADIYVSDFGGVSVGDPARMSGTSATRWYERWLMRRRWAWMQELGLKWALRRIWKTRA